MASKKNLKKDITFLVDEVLGTCLMRKELENNQHREEIDNIIAEILIFREELLNKVNHPKLTEADKNLRTYYRSLYQDLLRKVNESFDKLNELTE
jgi:flagellin-specific chaperone FliS